MKFPKSLKESIAELLEQSSKDFSKVILGEEFLMESVKEFLEDLLKKNP